MSELDSKPGQDGVSWLVAGRAGFALPDLAEMIIRSDLIVLIVIMMRLSSDQISGFPIVLFVSVCCLAEMIIRSDQIVLIVIVTEIIIRSDQWLSYCADHQISDLKLC